MKTILFADTPTDNLAFSEAEKVELLYALFNAMKNINAELQIKPHPVQLGRFAKKNLTSYKKISSGKSDNCN